MRALSARPAGDQDDLSVELPDRGALFLIVGPGRELMPGELRVVDAFCDLITIVVYGERRIGELESRLASIAELSTG